ncbi:hypothetical protein [Rickettsia endosymbiont of Halotydeus destructor]|uniref:hypothetical protein n=1 Tax=Rickettsia endosymbiont of Halotydeus destructor TaxID=2996754 RepID=UPI003BAE9F93
MLKEISNLNQTTNELQLKNKVKAAVLNLIRKLEQKYEASKIISVSTSKRQKEITDLLTNYLLEKNLSTELKEFLLTKEFRKYVKQIIEQHYIADSSSDESDIEPEITSHDEDQLSVKVFDLMQNIGENLRIFHNSIIEYAALIMPNDSRLLLKEILEDGNNLKLEKYLLLSKKYFPLFKKMFPDFSVHDLAHLARHCLPSFNQISANWLLDIYKNNMVAILGDEEMHELKIIDKVVIKLKQPVRFLSLGFNYSSILQTFPFIFPDEIEHSYKSNVEIGIKVFNTKGGYIEEALENGERHTQHLNSRFVDSDDLVRFGSGKKHLGEYLGVNNALNLLTTPYKSGWVNFILKEQIKQDVDFTFVVDKPCPASILKIYAKAKILPSYKEL